jgi:16S rRNA (adenine1518-N6/adenine1519-N6)-dimethyltransferase
MSPRRQPARRPGGRRQHAGGVSAHADSGRARPAGTPRRARKRFGQHFLERAWVEKLVQDIAPQADETFIEIGSGRGALTLSLADSGAQIIAIDIDRDLVADLAARVPANVTVVTGDFLTLPADDLLLAPRVRIVGNLPYNVSSPILFRLLELSRESDCLIDATLMLQREVAIRVAAGPGTGDYGPLSILTALNADVERRFDLPPGAFRPPPKVDSSVIRLRFRPPTVDVGDAAHFERMVRTLFQQRRKTVANALRPVLAPGVLPAGALADARIDPVRRPETLSLDELASLSAATTHPKIR